MSKSRVEPGLIRWQNHPPGRSQGLHTLFQRHKLAMGGYYNIIKHELVMGVYWYIAKHNLAMGGYYNIIQLKLVMGGYYKII